MCGGYRWLYEAVVMLMVLAVVVLVVALPCGRPSFELRSVAAVYKHFFYFWLCLNNHDINFNWIGKEARSTNFSTKKRRKKITPKPSSVVITHTQQVAVVAMSRDRQKIQVTGIQIRKTLPNGIARNDEQILAWLMPRVWMRFSFVVVVLLFFFGPLR